MPRFLPVLSVCLLCAAGLAIHGFAAEDAKPPQVVRNIIQRHDQSAVADKEILLGTAVFPPGASIGAHTHPGDEIGYMMKGSGTISAQGLPDRPLKAGDSFFNARGVVHHIVAGPEGATVVSTWIVDKGVPMATPVP